MIHLIAFMDIETGLGRTVYTDNTVTISEELIWPMIGALNNFVIECTESERGLVNAALEEIKIYLYSPLGEGNPLRLVFFSDLYENNYYIEKRGQAIFNVLSPYISFVVFSPPEEILEQVLTISKFTQIFPAERLQKNFLESMKNKLGNLENEGKLYVADLFVGDIDQGKVYDISSKEELIEKDSILLFSELLTAFSIDSEIFVRSSLSPKEKARLERNQISTSDLKEGWYLKQLSKSESDFWLVGYFFYKEKDESEILYMLDWIYQELSEEIIEGLVRRPF
ncbi:MAG: hypothetical protein KGD64_08285 [Candidatus Heimdallarchaeota archaeon]|nr:hypothetical protein [Candidatus Heimdallarchaeota archaeon]